MGAIRRAGPWIRGGLTVLTAGLTPLGAYAGGECSLRAALLLGVISAVAAAERWAAVSPLFGRGPGPRAIGGPS